MSDFGARVDGMVVQDRWVLLFDQWSYEFDRRGNYVPLPGLLGGAGEGDLDESVDHRLTSGSALATVRFTNTCRYVVHSGGASWYEQYACGYGVGSLTASWTGLGDLVRQSENTVEVTKVDTRTTREAFTMRDATATGMWDSIGIVGRQIEAKLFDSADRDVFVCHGTESC